MSRRCVFLSGNTLPLLTLVTSSPTANIIAKCISMRGSPPMCRRDMERAFELAEKHNIAAPVRRYKFDENDVKQAWRSIEQRDQFEAPVIEVHQPRQ